MSISSIRIVATVSSTRRPCPNAIKIIVAARNQVKSVVASVRIPKYFPHRQHAFSSRSHLYLKNRKVGGAITLKWFVSSLSSFVLLVTSARIKIKLGRVT